MYIKYIRKYNKTQWHIGKMLSLKLSKYDFHWSPFGTVVIQYNTMQYNMPTILYFRLVNLYSTQVVASMRVTFLEADDQQKGNRKLRYKR